MTLAADFRSASRNVRRGGWLSATVVLILAVAIGAVTAIFSIAHAVLIRPLPVVDPDRVMLLWGRDDARSQQVVEVSLLDQRAWLAGQKSFTAIELFGSVNWGELHVTGPGQPFRAVQNAVSSGFFDVLGARADDREDLPPRGRSSRCTADSGVERRRLAAAVLVRSLRRRTAADRRYGHEGRGLRSDRRHAAGLPHSRGRAGVDRARARARGRCRRTGMAGGRCPRDVRHRPPGARRDRRERRRRALDHRSQRGAEERDGEHVDDGRGDPVDDALARSCSSGAARDRRRLGRAAADRVRQRRSAAAGSRRRQEARGRREIRPRRAAAADRSATVLRIDRAVPDRRRSGCRSRVRELRCDRVARSDRSASPRRGRDRRPRVAVCAGPVPGDRGHGRALARMAPQRRRALRRTSRAFAVGDRRRPLPRARASCSWRRSSWPWWCS